MRTFIAIELPRPVQEQVNQLQLALQKYLRDQQNAETLHWTPVAKIHLTLRFLGETREIQQASIARDLRQIALNQPTFQLSFVDLGCFPNFRAPSVVWLGLHGELAALQQLQRQIEQAVRQADFAPEPLPFAPHITLGRADRNSKRSERQRVGAALQDFHTELAMQRRHLLQIEPFVVDQLVHMQSELRPEGARYTLLRHYPFG